MPSFPPLFRGAPAPDPFAAAIDAAREGTDPGLITHEIRPDRLRAALVLAPEAPLADAMAMVFAAANGFGDAFGSLAPSEVGCHFEWPDQIRINGARAGHLRAAASTQDPAAEPDWLVIGLEVQIFAKADTEPGATPDRTTLWDEGCAEVEPLPLLEYWSRHTLVRINDWLDDGMARLHRDWRARAWKLGEDVTVTLGGETQTGIFTGLDEQGGMVLKGRDGTRLLPLHLMLEAQA